jgi:hypothetical protein
LAHFCRIDTLVHAFRRSEMNHAGYFVVTGVTHKVHNKLDLGIFIQ